MEIPTGQIQAEAEAAGIIAYLLTRQLEADIETMRQEWQNGLGNIQR